MGNEAFGANEFVFTGDRTTVTVTPLSPEERVAEVAHLARAARAAAAGPAFCRARGLRVALPHLLAQGLRHLSAHQTTSEIRTRRSSCEFASGFNEK